MGDPRFAIAFRHPADPDMKIWRYMDPWKFTSMLEHGRLFFCRLDCLPDKFEGSISKLGYERFMQQYNDVVMKASGHFTEIHSLKRVMVNCWHMDETESAAMWKLYTEGPDAVCFQSTFACLRDCLGDSVKGIGMVNYIDYAFDAMKNDQPFYSRFLHRPKWFEHERELRALIYNLDGDISTTGEWRPATR
jgi:hypothetical protein